VGNNIRLGYAILSVALIIVVYLLSSYLTENQNIFNLFSYYGTLATIVALVIAAGEVMHSMKTTKTIQEQSLQILKEVKTIELASNLSDCLAAIDSVNKEVFQEKYDSAITNFQYFRKLCVKVIPGFTLSADGGSVLNKLGDVELMLLKATKTHDQAPLNKFQKTGLLKNILLIKQEIEAKNPAKGTGNVTI